MENNTPRDILYLKTQFRSSPMSALGVILNLGIRLHSEPRWKRLVLLHGNSQAALGAKGLQGWHRPKTMMAIEARKGPMGEICGSAPLGANHGQIVLGQYMRRLFLIDTTSDHCCPFAC